MLFLKQFVVELAKQAAVTVVELRISPERKLVPRCQLLVALRAPETVDVVNAIVGTHDQIVFAKAFFTFRAFFAEQSLSIKSIVLTLKFLIKF